MAKRFFLTLAVAAAGVVTFSLPLAVNAADETCSCSARKEWVAIRAAEIRAEREAEATALAAGQTATEASAATEENSSEPTAQE
jgi:hypothetical protein